MLQQLSVLASFLLATSIEGTVVLPILLPIPEYRDDVVEASIEGTVRVYFDVGAGGLPENIQLLYEDHFALGRACITSVSGLRYMPRKYVDPGGKLITVPMSGFVATCEFRDGAASMRAERIEDREREELYGS